MTRSIEECYLLASAGLHLVSTDVLGDTASLASHHVGASDEVQQLGLTVVDVTHDGDDRSSWDEVFRIVRLVSFSDGFLHVHALELDFEAELLCYDLQNLSVQTLVDGDEHAEAHAGSDDLGHRDVHQCCQLVGGDELRDLEDFLFLHFVHSFLLKLILDVVTFLTTVL